MLRLAAIFGAIAVAVYFVVAYVVLPALWSRYERQPRLAAKPMIIVTAQGIPGDPINVGLVGSKDEIASSFARAGWIAALPITLRTSIKIAESVLLDRPDPAAPVSALFYDGRREDLAFEMDVGGSADRRHHIRLWKVLEDGAEGRPVWLGSASFDDRAGLSHLTGQITHHIAPDVDAERAFVVQSLQKTGAVSDAYTVPGAGATGNGRNGEGDRYFTDGVVLVAVLRRPG